MLCFAPHQIFNRNYKYRKKTTLLRIVLLPLQIKSLPAVHDTSFSRVVVTGKHHATCPFAFICTEKDQARYANIPQALILSSLTEDQRPLLAST